MALPPSSVTSSLAKNLCNSRVVRHPRYGRPKGIRMSDAVDGEKAIEEEPPGVPEPESTEDEVPSETMDELAAKAEGYLANWKRAEADMVNLKKKVEQDRQALTVYANAMLISGLLPVLDDFQRAFDTLDTTTADLTWVEGLQLIYRKLISTMEGQGLTAIPTVGEPFDPSIHEAVMQADGPEGHVVEELQKGYRYRDRILRPAMVKVGNGSTASDPV